MIAFVLILAQCQKETVVYDDLMTLPEVTELHPLFGDYDMIAKVEMPTVDGVDMVAKLGVFVLDHVRKHPYVVDCKTLPTYQL